MTMSAPASANPRAIALPKPLLPPVTKATLPASSNSDVVMIESSLMFYSARGHE
jgi:hypothetical protein